MTSIEVGRVKILMNVQYTRSDDTSAIVSTGEYRILSFEMRDIMADEVELES